MRFKHLRKKVQAVGDKRAALLALEIRNLAVRYAPVDTGRLRQSIGLKQIGPGHWRVGTNVAYALYVEFGTRFTAPAAFFRKALRDALGGT
ncbi:HK97 gp10 family phage protein [Deinococcus actinosclerus]|uniref:HK97 gp10 family phage protein n=1 Tax=Deinococcus actinosclerus TaxID=1768108 RepID=A0ABM5X775_9DEIO|nr:HK97 gp10 family phage protein [Deinococcus actinosclerus]ALW89622.1 hypothetical protein AUC44_12535 [Deinococcus actinosclerus]